MQRAPGRKVGEGARGPLGGRGGTRGPSGAREGSTGPLEGRHRAPGRESRGPLGREGRGSPGGEDRGAPGGVRQRASGKRAEYPRKRGGRRPMGRGRGPREVGQWAPWRRGAEGPPGGREGGGPVCPW